MEAPIPTITRENEEGRPFPVSMATIGRVGDLPWAPGTAGSAVAILLVALFNLVPFAPAWRAVLLSLTVGIVFAFGVWSAGIAEQFFHTLDPEAVVLDEFVGQMIPFGAEPSGSWKLLLLGFVAFRFFDILKPFPAQRAERLPAGWGIMVDDVVAGFYALAVIVAVRHIGQ
jgi:phosphatidylglycerophosphatase A